MIRIILIWLLLTFPAQASSLRELVEKHSTTYNHTEISCLSKAVYFEARGESLEGQLAVAQVIMNRVSHKRYPKTTCSVINKEFTFNKSRQPNGKSWIIANSIAYIAFHNLWKDITNKATHFHNIRVNPRWRYTHTTTIGAHKFYRID